MLQAAKQAAAIAVAMKSSQLVGVWSRQKLLLPEFLAE